jgi:hypothetical protein
VQHLVEWLKLLGLAVAHLLIDAAFIVAWWVIQFGFHRLTEFLPMDGPDAVRTQVIEWLFLLATFAPILGYLYVDISRICIRAHKLVLFEVRSQLEQSIGMSAPSVHE